MGGFKGEFGLDWIGHCCLGMRWMFVVEMDCEHRILGSANDGF